MATRLLPGETGAEFANRCAAFADLGIDHVTVLATGPWTLGSIATIAQAAKQLTPL